MKELQLDDQGLVPVVVQEAETGTVLLLAYMNREALEATQRTSKLYLWSRSRGELWLKGEVSGHYQHVEELRLNCEGNSLLALVRSQGPACHDGYDTCFYRQLNETGATTVVERRAFDPGHVYGSRDNP